MKRIKDIVNISGVQRKVYTQGLLLGLIALMGALFFTLYFIVQVILSRYQVFLKSANLSSEEFIDIIKKIDRKKEITTQTFLILGTDTVENRPDFPQLTDTVMMVQLNPANATVNILPLPRDLWNDGYKTKINALYEYGKERNPEDPTAFSKEVISQMTGQEIDRVIIISLDQLAQMIDLFGCIQIEVEEGFVDEKFPRTDVDITTERDPAKLYETIEFRAGSHCMDGATALKYIRSRNSSNSSIGNDLDRSSRQQEVISAIVENLSNPKLFWYYPNLAGELLKFYNKNFDQYLKIEEAGNIGIKMIQNHSELKLHSLGLSIYPEDNSGVIEHPDNLTPYDNQWVYTIRNQFEFEQFIKQSFEQY